MRPEVITECLTLIRAYTAIRTGRNEPMDDAARRLWISSLEDLDDHAGVKAVEWAVRDREETLPLLPATVRAKYRELTTAGDPTPGEAFAEAARVRERFTHSWRYYIPYGDIEADPNCPAIPKFYIRGEYCPAIAAAISGLGGWESFCLQDRGDRSTNQAQFERRFKDALQQCKRQQAQETAGVALPAQSAKPALPEGVRR